MPARRDNHRSIGATQPPDLACDELRSVEIKELEARFIHEDVEIRSAALANADASSGCFREAHIEDVDLQESKLRSVDLVDVIVDRMDAANSDWKGAHLRRVLFRDARLTGLDFAEARMEEVTFKGCRLDYANFRHSTIEHVSFEDCRLDEADFQGASIDATRFSGCQLTQADFSKAKLSLVDLRGSELGLAGSVLLAGAIIDRLQLIDLAPVLAQELGITVEDS